MEIKIKVDNIPYSGYSYEVGYSEDTAFYLKYYEDNGKENQICFADDDLDSVIKSLIALRDFEKVYNKN